MCRCMEKQHTRWNRSAIQWCWSSHKKFWKVSIATFVVRLWVHYIYWRYKKILYLINIYNISVNLFIRKLQMYWQDIGKEWSYNDLYIYFSDNISILTHISNIFTYMHNLKSLCHLVFISLFEATQDLKLKDPFGFMRTKPILNLYITSNLFNKT